MEYYSELKSEWNSETWYGMEEPWRHNAKWNKTVTKGQILYTVIYMRYLVKFIKTENRMVVARDWVGRAWGVTAEWIQCFFWGMIKTFWNQIEVVVAQQCECSKCHWIVHLKMTDFILHAFYLKKKRTAREGRRIIYDLGNRERMKKDHT